MRSSLLLIIPAAWLRVLGWVSLCAAQTAPAAAPEAPSAERVQAWVRELDADRFVAREAATEHLIAAQLAAVQPVAAAVTGGSLELATRAIYVLQELALSSHPETAQAARTALEALAAPRFTASARRAEAALASLNEIRRDRAMKEVQRLGGRIGTRHVQVGLQIVEEIYSVAIDDQWRGGDQGLAHLQWLTGIEQLSLEGPQVTDAWLTNIRLLEDLTSLTLKRTSITDEGLAHVVGLPRLEQLSLLYLPIGDNAVQHLGQLKNPQILRIFGTLMTPPAIAQLQLALAGTKIDYRRGAFLGIGCQPNPEGAGCFVTHVQPDSAAEKAGFQIGDVVTMYGGEKVADFESLTALLARNAPGEAADVEVLRGDRKLVMRVTLGEWD